MGLVPSVILSAAKDPAAIAKGRLRSELVFER